MPEPRIGQITVTLGGQVDVVDVSSVVADGVRAVFVSHAAYFDREYLYGAPSRDYPDNPERFAFLSQAALTWAATTGQPYDIVHAHDWQTGLVPYLATRTVPAWQSAERPATIFTIHNLAYQGIFDASWLPRLGLGWDLMRVDALEFWNRISFLKGGIVFAGIITTVSPRYAEEIQTPELGFGFDGILRARSADLVGILNGIDYDQWDPERDANLPSALQRVKDDRKSGGQAKGSRNVWIAPNAERASPAAGSDDFEDGRAEGVRSPGPDFGCVAGAAGVFRPARNRRATVRGAVAGSGRSGIRPGLACASGSMMRWRISSKEERISSSCRHGSNRAG